MDAPYVTQRLHHEYVADRRRHVRRVQGFKQDEPVAADLQGESLTVLTALVQSIVLDPASVSFEPVRTGDPTQPVGCRGSQVVQRGAQRLTDQFEEVEIMHGGQHVGAVRALLATCLDQATGLETLQHPVEQEVFRPLPNKAGPELRQGAEVETGIGQLEPKRVFPVDAGPNGVSCLPVTQVLQELKHRDQRQAPGRQTGLAPGRVKRTEVRILEHGAEFVAQSGDHRAFGEGRTSHSQRLSRDLTDRLRT